jgi:hypothetical protein
VALVKLVPVSPSGIAYGTTWANLDTAVHKTILLGPFAYGSPLAKPSNVLWAKLSVLLVNKYYGTAVTGTYKIFAIRKWIKN